jgi:aminoglycoside phosphotransferase (APT) family kinase protein
MNGEESRGQEKAQAWAQLKEHGHAPELVAAGLQNWMRARRGDPQLLVAALETPGGTGVANETILFEAHRSDGTVEGYVARIATADPLYLDDDLSIHYRMYEAMAAEPSVPTPNVLGYEPDPGILGSPFFVMGRIDGLIPKDNPPWWVEGFIADASPAERRMVWERTVRMMADFHQLDPGPFAFLRSGATDDGVGDSLDYWIRSLHWAGSEQPIPLTDIAEQWLLTHRPTGTGLSWGDSRLPNVIFRDHTPVAMLDWDLVSLAGPQADLAWWIIMTAPESLALEGIGSHDDLVDLWEELTGKRATDLRWYLVFGAYRLAAILAKLFSTFVEQGRMPAELARLQLDTGNHVQLIAGLLDIEPPAGVVPLVPDVRLDRD